MSGIAGVLHLDGAAAHTDEVGGALAALARRGPAGRRSWCRGPIALACAQSRTTPQSVHETLPLADRAHGLTLVHDARLDNREELRAQLGPLTHEIGEVSDGELILAAWRRWGGACPEHLLGDFAFAIWDENGRALFLARDQIGIRTLFWFASAQVVAFASEIKALIALPGVPRRLDPERVADYLVGIAPDRGATFHAGVRRLLAGESVLAGEGGANRRRYHELALPEATHAGTVEEVAAGFREVFTTAVRDRLRAARPVAAMLSGGLDSSAIVCTAREIARAGGALPLPTISYVFSQTPVCDETQFIRSVVDQGGLDPAFFDGDASSPLDGVDALLATLDEPFDGAHLPYRRAIGALAARSGIGVLLEGSCGDAVTSDGLFLLAELARHGRLLRLSREIGGLARTQRIPPRVLLRRYVIEPNLPSFLRRLRRASLRRTARFQTPHFASSSLAARVGLDARFEAYWHSQPPPRDERAHHLREVLDHLPGSTFELTYAAEAVEPRYPYLDRRVIDYCLAVPAEHQVESGMTRMLMRRAFAGVLPAAVAARKSKANPSASLMRRFFAVDRELIEEALARPATAPECRHVDIQALRAAYRRGASWAQANPGAQPPSPLWLEAEQLRKAVVLIRWLGSTRLED